MFIIKEGDTKRSLVATLTKDGVAIDVTNISINFRVVGNGGKVIVDKAPDILDAINGKVFVVFESNEISEVGDYKSEFILAYKDGRVESFPNDDYLDFIIKPKL